MKLTTYNSQTFKNTKYYKYLSEEEKETFDTLTAIFAFKASSYVLEELINWNNIPNDPIYRLVFPKREMLSSMDYIKVNFLVNTESKTNKASLIASIKTQMYPRQMELHDTNYIKQNNSVIRGMTRDSHTITLFPSPMTITCHSYCTYCFRWPIYNNKEVQQKSSYTNPQAPTQYLKQHPEINEALFSGAEPLIASASVLKKYIDPILEIDTIQTICISTKSLSYWPYRYTTDKDAEEILNIFKHIIAKGKHLCFVAHLTHVKELETDVVKQAIKRIQSTGAVIRCQGPLIKGINDTPEDWSRLWTQQLKLGMIPYYMFIEANHHPTHCFNVPIAKALHIFQQAQKLTSSAARTVRGPAFMYGVHRVLLDGVTTINGKKYFVLKNILAPPETKAEGKIKLVPYDENLYEIGDLHNLFDNDLATKSKAKGS